MQAIHSVGWHHEGKQFMCSHSDGSLTMWNLRNTTKPIQITFPHGEDQKPFKQVGLAGQSDHKTWDHGQINGDYEQGWMFISAQGKANGNEGSNKSRVPVLNVAGGRVIITKADLLRLLP